jgi:amino acid permease
MAGRRGGSWPGLHISEEDHVSTVTQSGTRSSGKRVGALILAVVGILLLILALIYVVTAAGSLPSFIPGHIQGSTGHHPLRAGVALVVGLVLLGGAWWLGFGGRKSASAS